MNESFFLGCPVEFQHVCLIYPPTIKEITTNVDYDIFFHLLTVSQEELEDEWTEKKLDMSTLPTPFEYILKNSYNNKEFADIVKKAFCFFIHENITFLYKTKTIIIGEITTFEQLQKLRAINEENYFEFQNLVRQSIGKDPIDPPNPNEHWRIKQMKAKARLRDRIKAKQGMGITLKTSISAICCMGLGITPLNVGDLTYYSLNNIISMYQEKEKYEADIQAIFSLANNGKIKPKYWIHN